ncbi:DUF502 domain-containing protein [Burkholderia stagnalis]|uniref:DUF502 domain-containing protein n=1 Tax=Burkholderia stagnalis TaxID=1503054 RepID=UPI0021AB3B36|nr:DUF502 domain-containing protein [Burkholderia stagnalis]
MRDTPATPAQLAAVEPVAGRRVERGGGRGGVAGPGRPPGSPGRVPGIGAVLTLAFIFVVGLATQNFIGQKLVTWWNAVVRHIPVVGPIYTSVKQVSDTLLSSSGNAFRKALLIEYPRRGSYTIAFLTGTPGGDVVNHLTEEYVSVYIPTTPNPTSGFFLMLPKSEVIELDMSVDAALKYIVSMGVVAPPAPAPAPARRPVEPPL